MLEGWNYGRKAIIRGATVPVTVPNFPAQFNLDASNYDFSQLQNSGADLRFTDDNLAAYQYRKVNFQKAIAAGEVCNKNLTFDVSTDLTDNFTLLTSDTTQTVSGGIVTFAVQKQDAAAHIVTKVPLGHLGTFTMRAAFWTGYGSWYWPVLSFDIMLGEVKNSTLQIFPWCVPGNQTIPSNSSYQVGSEAIVNIFPVPTRGSGVYHTYTLADNGDGTYSIQLDGGTAYTINLGATALYLGGICTLNPLAGWYNLQLGCQLDSWSMVSAAQADKATYEVLIPSLPSAVDTPVLVFGGNSGASDSQSQIVKNIEFAATADLTDNFDSVIQAGSQVVANGVLTFANTAYDKTNSIASKFTFNEIVDLEWRACYWHTNTTTVHAPTLHIPVISAQTGEAVSGKFFDLQLDFHQYQSPVADGNIIYYDLANSTWEVLCATPSRGDGTYHTFRIFLIIERYFLSVDGGGGIPIPFSNNADYKLGGSMSMLPLNGWYNDSRIGCRIDYIHLKTWYTKLATDPTIDFENI